MEVVQPYLQSGTRLAVLHVEVECAAIVDRGLDRVVVGLGAPAPREASDVEDVEL